VKAHFPKPLAFLPLLLLFAPGIRAQIEPRSPMRSAMRILVIVRNSDNSPAPVGVSVRLEVDGGGLMDVQSTDSSGKVTFHPTVLTGYTIVVHQPGYKDAAKHVDLTLTPTAFVTLQLFPLPDASGPSGAPAGAGGTTIPIGQLTIPEEARKQFETGQDLLEEKHDVPGSIDHFRKAIKLHENFPQAYTLLGLAYLQDQKLSDSKAALERAVQLNPQSGAAYVGLGACLNQMKDFPAAEKALLKGLELLPESPEGNYELAKAYWALRRWQDAEPHAVKAEKLQPDVPGVHVLMGNILLQERDNAGALKEFKEYLRMDPMGPMNDAVRTMVAKLEKAQGTPK
jgi:Tetratricopeptide repeat